MDPFQQDKQSKEYASLNKVLLHLVHHGLVSEIERRIIVSHGTLQGRQSAIHQLMREKSAEKASDILKILAHFHATGYSLSDLSCFQNLKSNNKLENDINSFGNTENKTNPMLNTTVVKNVFQYLKLDEILKCRLVCEIWSTVADPIVRKRARIVFGNLEPDRFVRIFQNYLPLQPFTSFVFNATENKDSSKMMSIAYFFVKWGRKIKELSLNQVTIRNKKGEDVKIFDISHWIRAAKNLKYLNILSDIDDSDDERTTLRISISSFLGVETLILNTCHIDLDEEIKISPSKISLAYNTFCRDKVMLQTISLNTIINLKEVKDLNISHYYAVKNKFETTPDLDFDKEPAKLDKLVLDNLESLNWQKGHNWQVNSLLLHDMDVGKKIDINIQELQISSTDWNKLSIDLSSFPDTIQKLTILRGNHMEFECTQAVNLPNLRHLCVDFIGDIPTDFADFLICLSLEDITFKKYCPSKSNSRLENFDPKQNLNLDLAIIPATVKTIKFNNKINFIGDKVLNLDQLILEECSLSKVEGILQKHIKPKVLFLDRKENYEINDSLVLFMSRNSLENLIVGKFDWTFWSFQESRLSKLVDKQSSHYEFKRNSGASITSEKFDEEMKLFTGSFDKEELQMY